MEAAMDPESEAVLEQQRLKDLEMDDFKDWCPKGRGNTKRL